MDQPEGHEIHPHRMAESDGSKNLRDSWGIILPISYNILQNSNLTSMLPTPPCWIVFLFVPRGLEFRSKKKRRHHSLAIIKHLRWCRGEDLYLLSGSRGWNERCLLPLLGNLHWMGMFFFPGNDHPSQAGKSLPFHSGLVGVMMLGPKEW